MCAKLRTAAASNNRDHPTGSLYYCLFGHIRIFLFFTQIPFVVNHAINTTPPPERLQQHPLLFTTNHTDRTFFVWRLNFARPSHPGHRTILLTCLSICNTQARAVNLIMKALLKLAAVRDTKQAGELRGDTAHFIASSSALVLMTQDGNIYRPLTQTATCLLRLNSSKHIAENS